MKKIGLLFLALTTVFASFSQNSYIQNVHILPISQDEVLDNRDVIILNGKIFQIAPTGTLEIPDSCEVIDGNGAFLLPGLSEMHAHIPVPQGDNDSLLRETMLLYLAKGVTVIRGMLGHPSHLAFRAAANGGRILAPRVYTSSPSMNGNSVPDSESANRLVRDYKQAGYDFLKIHPGIQLNVMQSLVRTAREVDMKYAGHVPADVGVVRALQYGFTTIDHADGYVEGLVDENAGVDWSDPGFFGSNLVDHINWQKMDELAQLTKDQNVWVVPTQSLFTRWISPEPAEEMMAAKEMSYLPPATRYAWLSSKARMLSDESYSAENHRRFVEARQRILRALLEKGVRFLLGSDSPQVMNVPGFSIHHEINSLVEAGIPVRDIIRSGTSNVADFFSESGTYGVVQVGADADLILVEKNPLQDVTTLSRPLGTLRNGKWMDRAFFAEELEKIAQKYAD